MLASERPAPVTVRRSDARDDLAHCTAFGRVLGWYFVFQVTRAGVDAMTIVAMAPDYAKWCDRKLWTVRDAVCLMLALEPDTARHDPSAAIGGFDPVELAIEQYGEHAEEAMRTGALQPFSREDFARPTLQRRVDPHAFLRCAKTWDVPIPDELTSGLAGKPQRPPVVPSTTLEQLGRGYLGADYIEEAREQVLGAALAVLKAY